jgi:HTH-type transcriptional regulator / antitoxin HigA
LAVKTAKRSLPDAYFELVRQFPLIHIRDSAHLASAETMLRRLLERELDQGEQEYLDVLTDLIEKYEADHEPIPDASEADVLRLLMESNGLSQMALARKVGISQSTISAVLHGTRSLTKEHVITLARFFNVGPARFCPGDVSVVKRGTQASRGQTLFFVFVRPVPRGTSRGRGR